MKKNNVFVKPVLQDGIEKWGVFEMSKAESIFYDWRHYGFRVAMNNALILLGMKRAQK